MALNLTIPVIELVLGLGILTCIFVFLVARKPIIGFVGFIFLVLTRAHEYIPHAETLRPSIGVGMIMLLGLFLFLVLNRAPIFFAGWQTLLLMAFIIFCWVSLFTLGQSAYDRRGYSLVEPLLLVLISYFALLNTVRNWAELKIVLQTFVVIGVTLALLSIIQSFFTGLASGDLRAYHGETGLYTRASTVGLGPNGLALMLATLLPWFFCHFENDAIMKKRLCQLSLPLMALTIFLTFSRGGFICMAVAFLLILRKRLSLKFLLGFAAVLIMIFIAVPDAFWERLATTGTTDTTGEGRLIIWQGALNMIREHPLQGVGYGQFASALELYQPIIHPTGPHNTYLGIAAETGMINLFIYLSLFLVSFKDLRRLKREATLAEDTSVLKVIESLSAGLIIALVSGLTGEQSYVVLIYLYLGLIVVLKRIWRQKRADMEMPYQSSREETYRLVAVKF